MKHRLSCRETNNNPLHDLKYKWRPDLDLWQWKWEGLANYLVDQTYKRIRNEITWTVLSKKKPYKFQLFTVNIEQISDNLHKEGNLEKWRAFCFLGVGGKWDVDRKK